MSLKIIYIMGSSRSGSTILDTVLSDHPTVFGAGELCNLISAMDLRNNHCACGAYSAQCPFWSEVRRRWSHTLNGVIEEEYPLLQARFERFNNRYRHYREHEQHDDPLMDKYLAQTRALFTAISDVSGTQVVVDSSKGPLRALALSRMRDVELRVVHLVRDVRGVVCSHAKSFEADPKGGILAAIPGERPIDTTVRWRKTNAIANRVRVHLGARAILVRYEDFVTRPGTTLERISALIGIDFGPVAAKLDCGGKFRTEHTIEGNRLRMQKRIELKPDVRWQSELTVIQRSFLPLLAAPVAWNYGYRPW